VEKGKGAVSQQIIPNCVDTERNVLGYCMLNAGYLDTCRADLEADDFELPQHVMIWHAICRIYDAGGQVERLTVYADLSARGESNQVGGLAYLHSIDDFLPLVPSIDSYVRQLHNAKIRRRIVFAASHIAKMAQDTASDLDTVIDSFGKSLVEITSCSSGRGPVSTRDMIETVGVTELLKPREESGVSLPWPRVQKALCGLQAGQMAVLMAATSRGKTSMALQVATCAALQGGTPVVWAMEMGEKSNFQRMVTQLSGVYATKQFASAEERAAHRRAVGQLEDHPIYFDTKSRSVTGFLGSLRQIRAKTPLGIAVVDHLQLIRSANNRNRAQEVSDNSRSLKLAAMDMGIPFLVLSQVDRSSVKGEGQIGLHSAKESGDIENDADIVMWIDGGELDRVQDSTVSLHIGKQREGPCGFSIPMSFCPVTQSFHEIAE
jgi:replicative DNA helicase